MIPYGRQDISNAEIDAVTAVLQSDFLTQGPAIPAFEKAVAKRCGASHAIAVNSATSALHIACLALDLGPGDWLWTSPNSFVASANVAHLCGARADFVDVDPLTWNLCPAHLEEKLLAADKAGTLPKIIMPVHFGGEPCDMAAIGALAKRYGIRVIEDASHAIGALRGDEPVGRCDHSDITVFSFHPVKIVTTAEGGVAATQQADLARRLLRLRTHGVTRDPAQMRSVPDGPWDYDMVELGLNYRMTDLQAALGSVQMDRIGAFLDARHMRAARYDAALAEFPVLSQQRNPKNYSALHLYPVVVSPAGSTSERRALRRKVYDHLIQSGIGVNVHYIPIHTQPWYRDRGFGEGDFPNAEHYYAGAISLPMFSHLSEADQDTVISALRSALYHAVSANGA
jgi:UDP-4-amino-4,6-dideoxy-N-acetyl-beta-L-altrosamine transaminase